MSPNTATSVKSLLSSAFWLTAILSTGRLLGYARELAIAHVVGANATSDQIVVLFTLPDLIFNIVLAGGVGSVLVPLLSRSSPELRLQVLNKTLRLTLFLFAGVACVLAFYSAYLAKLLAPGLSDSDLTSLAFYIVILTPCLVIVGVAGLFNAYQQSTGRFKTSGLGGIISNACIIVSIALAAYFQQHLLAIIFSGIFFGFLLRLYVAALPYHADSKQLAGGSINNSSYVLPDGFASRFVIALLSISIIQLIPISVRSAVSLGGPGDLTQFNYAIKLVELPLTLISAALSVVGLPAMSVLADRKDYKELRRYYGIQVLVGGLCALVLLGLGLLLGREMIELIFASTSLSPTEIDEVIGKFKTLLWMLPFSAILGPTIGLMNALDAQMRMLISALITSAVFGAFLSATLLLPVLSPYTTLALPFYYAVHAFVAYTLIRSALKGGSGHA